MKTVRIGCGAGFSGDRIDPAVELVEKGALDFLAFECLAERTIALAQLDLQRNPLGGFDPLLEQRFRAVLPAARANGVRIVTNMGAANPLGAVRAITEVAGSLGLSGLKVAAILGDNVMSTIDQSALTLTDRKGSVADLQSSLISANAYLGSEGIVEALGLGADIVVTGRVGDPSLFVAPLIHSFGWRPDDWERLARGTAVGHMLECAGQLTGGYFADPGRKDVPELARLGFPYADVDEDGNAVFSKVPGSGGMLSIDTCKEQLLYEVLDPSSYVQPDVIANFAGAQLENAGPDRVALSGISGAPRPEQLKVSVGYRDGFIAEGEISYAGPGAAQRGQLALDIIRERVALLGLDFAELDMSLIGLNSVGLRGKRAEPAEVRARIAGRSLSEATARQLTHEVEALYTNGPAGGGGVRKSVREVVAIASTLIDRSRIKTTIHIEES
ncbi:MAG: acyclic terpene utilization AtuA family protein [Novosphingobium sp.]